MHHHARSSSILRSTLLAALLASLALGCGGGGSGRLNVDSPINKFEPPDEADLLGDEADDADEPDDAAEAAAPADADGDM